MTTPTHVPGSFLPVSVDRGQLLADAYETNLIAASRREVQEAQRKGYSLSQEEARNVVAQRYQDGQHDVLPQYHSIKTRGAR